MSWPEAALAIVNVLQVVALAWIAAWQQRAAQLHRRTNGAVRELARRTEELEQKP